MPSGYNGRKFQFFRVNLNRYVCKLDSFLILASRDLFVKLIKVILRRKKKCCKKMNDQNHQKLYS